MPMTRRPDAFEDHIDQADHDRQDRHRGDGAPATAGTADPLASGFEPESTRRPLEDILADLSKPIKPRHLETKPDGNGGTLTFIPWYRAKKYLDHYTNGHWSKDLELWTTGRRIFVRVRLTIDAADATVSRSATGTELLQKVDANTGETKEIPYGDPSSNAESMAFRRACANFGLGLDLYED